MIDSTSLTKRHTTRTQRTHTRPRTRLGDADRVAVAEEEQALLVHAAVRQLAEHLVEPHLALGLEQCIVVVVGLWCKSGRGKRGQRHSTQIKG
jgi:hypothetical protein